MARRATTRKKRGTIVALIEDVFFGITVRNTIRKLECEAQIIKSIDELDQAVSVYEPDLVVLDMTVLAEDPNSWEIVRDVAEEGVRVLAFGPHREIELFQAARDAGVARVVSNSQFHRNMGELIERYALTPPEEFIEDEDDEDQEDPDT